VQLTVAESTKLDLNVERDVDSTLHTISGRLRGESSGIDSKTVRLKVNEKEYNLTTAYPDGDFTLTLNLPPANNQPTTYPQGL